MSPKTDFLNNPKVSNPRLSFVFVDSERVWRGGQAQLLTLIQGLHQRGHRIHLICFPNTSLEKRARDLGISVHPIAIRSETGLPSLFRMFTVLRSVHPDILAFNTPKPILMGTLASRFSRTGGNIIFRRVSFPLGRSFISRLKYTWGIDCVVAISQSIKAQLEKGGVPGSTIRIVYEGIDLSLYPDRPQTGDRAPEIPLTVGTVSHLSHEKGLRYLIEAASLIPDAEKRLQFVIVGDGNCRRELEDLVREKGLENCFQFPGFRTDCNILMKTFDMFVLPSLSEGLPSAIIEAMASSLPVIGSNVGGIPELVQSGQNGLLVPPGNPEELARAIQQLADRPETMRQMGLRGRKRVEETFTLQKKILETETLCTALLIQSKPLSGQPNAQ